MRIRVARDRGRQHGTWYDGRQPCGRFCRFGTCARRGARWELHNVSHTRGLQRPGDGQSGRRKTGARTDGPDGEEP
jgi:hypothetical protein